MTAINEQQQFYLLFTSALGATAQQQETAALSAAEKQKAPPRGFESRLRKALTKGRAHHISLRPLRAAAVFLICLLTMHFLLYCNVASYRQPVDQFFLQQTEKYDFLFFLNREEEPPSPGELDPADGYDEQDRVYPAPESFYKEGMDGVADAPPPELLAAEGDLFAILEVLLVTEPEELAALYAYFPYEVTAPAGYSLYLIDAINEHDGHVTWRCDEDLLSLLYVKKQYDAERDEYLYPQNAFMVDNRDCVAFDEQAVSVHERDGVYQRCDRGSGVVDQYLIWDEPRFVFSVTTQSHDEPGLTAGDLLTMAESLQRKP